MKKIEGIRKQLDELGMDCILITTQENVRYLTNFTGSSGAVLISNSEAKFLTDFRYAKQSHEQISGYEIQVTSDSKLFFQSIVDQVDTMNVKKLGFESSYVTHKTFVDLKERLSIELIPTTNVVEKMRAIKSESEIDLIRNAAVISDRAFERIMDFIRPGLTEREVANELEYEMRKEGATSSGFDMIIASGYRAALPHGLASDKIIENGDMITFDFGALYEGYRSDMTRTISLGEPEQKFKEIYKIVLDSLLLCEKQIKAGMPAKQVDAIVRDYITDKGYGEYFGHGTGHGIGLMIHEDPFFSKTSNQVLKTGMVVTIEPGIYLPDFGGVRIEDDVVIKNKGIEILTKSPKELIIL